MLEQSKIGTDWKDDELDAIVSDYFAMLDAEISGQRYVKAEHGRAVMARTGRSHKAVEFKHQNISAVLDELGIPWIRGYKPKSNYQNALFDAIDRYLTRLPKIFEAVRSLPADETSLEGVFVATPSLAVTGELLPKRLRRLVQKFDPVERDRRNRSLGIAGEEFVVDMERLWLTRSGRPDLARKIRWVAKEDGDGPGYDVLSFDPAGQERLLEVKTTNGSAKTPFFLTRNERSVAIERPEAWRIYRVHLFSTQPRIFTLAPPLEDAVHLRPETWRLAFSGGQDWGGSTIDTPQYN